MENLTVTRAELAVALAAWELQAATGNWAPRYDGDRHLDAADFLLSLIESGRAPETGSAA